MNEKYVIDKIKEIEEAGATPKEHTHTAADITSGTLDAARIPSLTASKISDFEAKVEEIAGGASGDITSTSITNSGTITSTGLITANGGVEGNLTGNVTGDVAGYLIRTKQETGSSSGNTLYYTIPALTLANNVVKEVTYSKPQYIISSNDIIKYIVSGGNLSGTIKFTVEYNRTSWSGKGSQSSNDTLTLEITLYDENNATLATTTLTNTIVVKGKSTQTTQTLYSAVSYNYANWNKVKYIKANVKSLVLTDNTLAGGATVNNITTTALNSYVMV